MSHKDDVRHSTSARGKGSDRWRTADQEWQDAIEIRRTLDLDPFDLDPCGPPVCGALGLSTFFPEHIDPAKRDGLAVRWSKHGTCAFVNPPYSEVEHWVQKGAQEHIPSLFLVFARTDCAWWHDWVVPHAAVVYFRRGRVKFVEPVTGEVGGSAPTGSAIVVFTGGAELVRRPVRVGRWAPCIYL